MKGKNFNFIYKTTCIVTNKYYLGKHETDNLNDGYLGSGLLLEKSIKKHGKENHFREIIEFLPNRELLFKKEKEIINEDLLQDPLCMNLRVGGYGGYISKEVYDRFRKNFKIENVKNWLLSAAERNKRNQGKNYIEIYGEEKATILKNKQSQTHKDLIGKNERYTNSLFKLGQTYEERYGEEEGKRKREHLSEVLIGENNPFYNHKHTEESKQKNREAHIGKCAGDKNPSKRPEVREKIKQYHKNIRHWKQLEELNLF